jgi:integrase
VDTYLILKPADSKGMARVYLVGRIEGKLIWLPIGIKVKAQAWTGNAVNHKQPSYKQVNALLRKRQAMLFDIQYDLDRKRIPLTAEVIKNEWKALIKPNKAASSITRLSFINYIDHFMRVKSTTCSKNYLRHFKQIRNHLVSFNPSIDWNDITSSFYSEYTDHLIEAGLENNTIGSHFKRIGTLMDHAAAAGYTVPQDYRQFKDVSHKVNPIWLTWPEVELLARFNPLPEKQVYLDEFLLRCYTGLRWSDVHNLRPHHIIPVAEGAHLSITSIKTRAALNITLSTPAFNILKKYKFKLPALYQHDCNHEIKYICRAAGITNMVEKVRFMGSRRMVQVLPKYLLVTTHTARRTFGRRWVDAGGDIVNLSKYLGHSSVQQTMDYVGYDGQRMNDEMKRIFG